MTVSVQMKPLQQFHMVPFVFLLFDKKKKKKKKEKARDQIILYRWRSKIAYLLRCQ